jgi:ABC-2 type transport system ATP-binding protein
MLQLVNLDFKRNAFANTLSRGQTQRLGLARVLLHDPTVLLLDEPLSGLDPRARIDMRNLLRHLGTMGKAVIVSSHILPELADVCNKIGIIDQGVLSVSASMTDVMRQVRQCVQLRIRVVGDGQVAANLLRDSDKVDAVQLSGDELSVQLKPGVSDHTDLAEKLVLGGCRLAMYREDELDLEAAFMALTKDVGWKGDLSQ